MSIRAIEDSKLLKKYGKRLGREGLSLRIIELCKKVATEENYKEAVMAAGRIHALSLACRYESYWEEKSRTGFWDELLEAERALGQNEGGQ